MVAAHFDPTQKIREQVPDPDEQILMTAMNMVYANTSYTIAQLTRISGVDPARGLELHILLLKIIAEGAESVLPAFRTAVERQKAEAE